MIVTIAIKQKQKQNQKKINKFPEFLEKTSLKYSDNWQNSEGNSVRGSG
jgi:hypothetical protein